MGSNKVERLLALPTHLAYMGWCNLSYSTRVTAAEFREHSRDFQVKLTATESFEVVGQDKLKKKSGSITNDDKMTRTQS